jgi:arylformamidase
MQSAWTAQGNKAELSAIEGANHFTVIHGFESPDSALCNWLAAQLGA